MLSDQNTALHATASSSRTHSQFMSSNIEKMQISGSSSKQAFFRNDVCRWFIELEAVLVLPATSACSDLWAQYLTIFSRSTIMIPLYKKIF
jgi:hypothetical protein